MKSALYLIPMSVLIFSTLSSMSFDKTVKNVRLVATHNYYQEARFFFLEFESRNGERFLVRTPVGNLTALYHKKIARKEHVDITFSRDHHYRPSARERTHFAKHQLCSGNGPDVTCRDQMLLQLK